MSKRRKKKAIHKFCIGKLTREKYETFGEWEKWYLDYLRKVKIVLYKPAAKMDGSGSGSVP